MDNYLDISQYTIYKLKTDNTLRVAVPLIYRDQVQQLIKEYGTIEKIPSSKTVRGIFIKNHCEGNITEMLTSAAQENDITVNQLEVL